jgi:hypothetical protein
VLLDPPGLNAAQGAALEQQAVARSVRLGQARKVTVTRFIMVGTIEEDLALRIEQLRASRTMHTEAHYRIEDTSVLAPGIGFPHAAASDAGAMAATGAAAAAAAVASSSVASRTSKHTLEGNAKARGGAGGASPSSSTGTPPPPPAAKRARSLPSGTPPEEPRSPPPATASASAAAGVAAAAAGAAATGAALTSARGGVARVSSASGPIAMAVMVADAAHDRALATLVDMGFTVDVAHSALQECKWNFNSAIEKLLTS